MAWTLLSSVNGYHIASESLTLPDSAGATETSVNSSYIGENVGGPVDVSNTIFGITCVMTETTGGDGALDARLQGSVDNSTWVNIDTSASMDVDTTTTTAAAGVCTATNNYFPYWRIQLFTDGTDTLDDGTVTLKIAVKELPTVRSVV